MPSTLWSTFVCKILSLLLLAGVSASAQSISLTFYTNTAAYAALGAPIGYVMVATNTGTATTKVTTTVTLTAPDTTVYSVYTSSPTITAGSSKTVTSTFTSSTLTSQLGSFTLTATVTSNKGVLLATAGIPVSILAVPANGIAVSVGGQGPDNANLGYTYDFETVTTNLTTATITVRTQPNLVKTDSTTIGLDLGKLTAIAPGKAAITAYVVTTTQYSTLSGTYAVNATVYDSGNNVQATDQHNFTRNSLPTANMPATFTDQAVASGLVATRQQPLPPPGCGAYTDFALGGAGGAIGDYDGDGNDDIFAVDNYTGIGHLWHNNGSGVFTDMISTSGIPVVPYESGADFVDIDNDGHPDLLILVFNGSNELLHNNGNGTFSDITASSGLNANPVPQNSQSVTFGDYDGDGFLDAYVVVHADCTGVNQNDHLLHNNGNNTFTDVTSLLGGSGANQVNGRGLVGLFFDYNQDGRPDIYVGNDEGSQIYSRGNVLWRNDGSDGKGGWIFTDVSSASGAGVAISSMGIGISDYNHSGNYDMFVTNYGANYLLQQISGNTFVQQAGDGFGGAHVKRATMPSPTPGVVTGACANGFTCTSITWGTAFYDFNNDTWEDIYMVGGNTRTGGLIYPNAYLQNNGDGTFLDLTTVAGTTNTLKQMMPTGLFGDFNNDGFMDIFQWGQINQPQFFVNTSKAAGNVNNWLEVKLVATKSNHDAVGARLTANVNGVNLLRYVYNGGTYQGNSTLIQHFGLGSATSVPTLTITWPDGEVQTLTNVAANQKLVVTEQ
jgi:hypothetical protein